MAKIIPAILPQTYREIETAVSKVKDIAHTIQIDFVDGTFATNRTWLFNNKDQEKLSAIMREEEGLPFWADIDYEFDLMVKDPLKHMETFMALGPSKLIFHIEGLEIEEMVQYFESLPEIIKSTVKFGLALSLDTDPVLLAPLAPYISSIQCMGIAQPGFQGQPFDERVYEMIQKVRFMYPEKIVAVDGAVSLDNIQKLIERGATQLVVGSVVFQSVDPQGTIEKLKYLCKKP